MKGGSCDFFVRPISGTPHSMPVRRYDRVSRKARQREGSVDKTPAMSARAFRFSEALRRMGTRRHPRKCGWIGLPSKLKPFPIMAETRRCAAVTIC